MRREHLIILLDICFSCLVSRVINVGQNFVCLMLVIEKAVIEEKLNCLLYSHYINIRCLGMTSLILHGTNSWL